MTTPGPAARLARECLADPALVLGAVAALLTAALAQLSLPALVRTWLDQLLHGHDTATMIRLGGWSALALCVVVLAASAARLLLALLAGRMVQRIRVRLSSRLLAAPLGTVHTRPIGELVSTMLGDSGATALFVDTVLRRMVGEGAVVLGALAAMWLLDWRVTLAAALSLPPLALVFDTAGRAVRRRAARARERMAGMSATLQEQLRGFTTIRTFQTEAFEQQRFDERSRAYARAMWRAELSASALPAVVFVLAGLCLVAIVVDTARRAAVTPGSEGALVAMALYAAQIVDPLRRLSEVHGGLQLALAAADRCHDLEVELAPEADVAVGSALDVPAGAEFALEAVDFHYRDAEPVLAGVDLTVLAGSSLALVGGSGGGKSTLASLLPRLLTATAGRVTVGGLEVGTRPARLLRREVCLVEQDPFVFRGSLLDNLRYGSPHASAEQARAVATRLGLGTLVESRGVEGWLHEAGRDLSGGQKQRVALARAVLRNPAVLVLDEALSAVDGDTEVRLFAALSEWFAGRTVVVISHRLATVQRLPRAALLDGGRIVDVGATGDLAARNPTFRELFADQWIDESGRATLRS